MALASCAAAPNAHGAEQPARRPRAAAASGTPKVLVHVSRTSGVAPLAVFFDATTSRGLAGDDFVNASFEWDFDAGDADPTGTDETATGFLAAHVFRRPGSYRIECRATDKQGRTGRAVARVAVSRFRGRTFCVAAHGNDRNPGTIDAPLRTVQYALSNKATANTRILLRRGDTFNFDRLNCSKRRGPVIVGSYEDRRGGDRAAPVLRCTAGSGGAVTLTGTQDWRFVGLHLTSAETRRTSAFNAGGGADHLLLMDVQTDGFNIGFYLGHPPKTTHGFFVFDSLSRNPGAYGVFGTADRFAFVSSAVLDQGANGHGIRVAGGNKTLIRNSLFRSRHTAFTSVTIRGKGDGTANTQAVISGNRFDRIAQSGPQNTTYAESISDVLWEHNLCEGGAPAHGSIGIQITARRVAVRDNVFVNLNTAVSLKHHPAVTSDDVHVHHNTQLVDRNQNQAHFLLRGGGTRIDCHHNVHASASTVPWGRVIAFTGEPGELSEDRNCYFAPRQGAGWAPFKLGGSDFSLADWQRLGKGRHTVNRDPGFVSTEPEHPDFLRLRDNSPVHGAGARLRANRPVASGWSRAAAAQP